MAVYQYAKTVPVAKSTFQHICPLQEQPQQVPCTRHVEGTTIIDHRQQQRVPQKGPKIQPRGKNTKTQQSSAILCLSKRRQQLDNLRERRHLGLLFHGRLLQHRLAEMLQPRTTQTVYTSSRDNFSTRRLRPTNDADKRSTRGDVVLCLMCLVQ